ncbi:Eco29kI family restriction endonuclease [Streptomyces griseoluteus]
MKMLEMDPVPITSVPKMSGAGIYAIYYEGDHELYRPIASECQTPIYVGKAEYSGGRKGLITTKDGQTPLWKRINEHRSSLDKAVDLAASDFCVRYLVAVDVFVSLAEQVMIQRFTPVWNTVVDGFGNHAPGGGRDKQARPPWDELHPGRTWAQSMPASNQSAARSRELIFEHFKRRSLIQSD